MTLLFSQLRLKLDRCLTYINSHILNSIYAMAFSLGMTVDLCMSYNFDDLDLDARSQWVGKGKKAALNYLNN